MRATFTAHIITVDVPLLTLSRLQASLNSRVHVSRRFNTVQAFCSKWRGKELHSCTFCTLVRYSLHHSAFLRTGEHKQYSAVCQYCRTSCRTLPVSCRQQSCNACRCAAFWGQR